MEGHFALQVIVQHFALPEVKLYLCNGPSLNSKCNSDRSTRAHGIGKHVCLCLTTVWWIYLDAKGFCLITSGTKAHPHQNIFRFTEENVHIMADIYFGEETGGHSLIRNEKLEYYLRYIGDPCYEINMAEKMFYQPNNSKPNNT